MKMNGSGQNGVELVYVACEAYIFFSFSLVVWPIKITITSKDSIYLLVFYSVQCETTIPTPRNAHNAAAPISGRFFFPLC